MDEDILAKIECQFAYKCPQVWQLLDPTDQEGIRYCGECQREVFLCSSEEELRAHAKQGHCVAVGFSAPDEDLQEEDEKFFLVGDLIMDD